MCILASNDFTDPVNYLREYNNSISHIYSRISVQNSGASLPITEVFISCIIWVEAT
jgi:hypothetical protein